MSNLTKLSNFVTIAINSDTPITAAEVKDVLAETYQAVCTEISTTRNFNYRSDRVDLFLSRVLAPLFKAIVHIYESGIDVERDDEFRWLYATTISILHAIAGATSSPLKLGVDVDNSLVPLRINHVLSRPIEIMIEETYAEALKRLGAEGGIFFILLPEESLQQVKASFGPEVLNWLFELNKYVTSSKLNFKVTSQHLNILQDFFRV